MVKVVESGNGGKNEGRRKKGVVMIKAMLTAVLMGVFVLSGISSCKTVATGPLTSAELRLLSINVPEGQPIKVKKPYEVSIHFEADGEPKIETACFYWSGDGPHCFKVKDANFGSPGSVKVKVRTNNPGEYILQAYVMYIRDGKPQKSNVLTSRITIGKGSKR